MSIDPVEEFPNLQEYILGLQKLDAEDLSNHSPSRN